MARSARITDDETSHDASPAHDAPAADAAARRYLRIRFRKEGDLRWVGHLDLMRAFERLMRRAELPLAHTQGCHPRPRLSFPQALPVGETGANEVALVELAGGPSREEIHRLLAAHAPEGIAVTEVEELSAAERTADPYELGYEFALSAERHAEVAAGVERLLAQPSLLVARGGEPPIDMRDLLLTAAVEAGVLRFRLRVPRGRQLRARDVLEALGLDDLRAQGLYPTRTEVLVR